MQFIPQSFDNLHLRAYFRSCLSHSLSLNVSPDVRISLIAIAIAIASPSTRLMKTEALKSHLLYRRPSPRFWSGAATRLLLNHDLSWRFTVTRESLPGKPIVNSQWVSLFNLVIRVWMSACDDISQWNWSAVLIFLCVKSFPSQVTVFHSRNSLRELEILKFTDPMPSTTGESPATTKNQDERLSC
jgi:hypothetical protein